MKVKDIKEGLRDPKDNPCWKGYKPVGTKKKGGRTVPNCVPKESVAESTGDLFDQWMNSEYAPLDDESGDDNAVFKKAIHFAADVLDSRSDSEALAWKLVDKFNGVDDSEDDMEEGYGRGYGRSSWDTSMPDWQRREQDAWDADKRAFKRAELQHELGHEDDPDFERNFRQQQIDRDRGPWYLKVNGKILKVKGEPKVFDWKKGANNYALAVLKNKPELQGKIFLTKKLADDPSEVAEDKNTVKVPVTQKPRQGPLRPQTGGGAHRDKKKEQKQGKEKHRKPFAETGSLKVAKDDDNMTILQNPATGVQTQIDKKNPNAPRITQDETGKLKLQTPNASQSGGPEEKPNIIGKDVEISTPPVEEVSLRISAAGNQPGDEITDVNPRSAISGDEDHDEISKLLNQRLRKLAGL